MNFPTKAIGNNRLSITCWVMVLVMVLTTPLLTRSDPVLINMNDVVAGTLEFNASSISHNEHESCEAEACEQHEHNRCGGCLLCAITPTIIESDVQCMHHAFIAPSLRIVFGHSQRLFKPPRESFV